MYKPTWMSAAEWESFRDANSVAICSECGEDENHLLTVARAVTDGGLLVDRWLCGFCEDRQRNADARRWTQQFYFDHPLNLEAARTAHRQLFETVLHHAGWFSQPFSRINRLLYANAWVVGAGKTLGTPVLACALNHVIRRDCGAAWPRIDRVLVLTKEVAIRDQIARDLADDTVKFGLLPLAPRVGILSKGEYLNSRAILETKDVWVSCVQMLFEQNGSPVAGIEEKLANFPLIVFDELHYAMEQVLMLVQQACRSLCVGMTGTPIKADGQQIRRLVLLSLFDYRSAHEYDRSMKDLPSPESTAWKNVFEEVDIVEADMVGKGQAYKTETTDTEGYNRNIRPAITVAEAVVRHVHDCDRMFRKGEKFTLALHRKEEDISAVADLIYPSHAMIQAESITAAEIVAGHLNRMFEADRRKYPVEAGYRAEVVRSTYEDGDGKKARGKKLDPDHPWMLCKKKGGKLTKECSRFLVVVDMGREGVNNPYCNVVGVGCTVSSILGHVQRTIGRQVRSVIRWAKDRLHVAPDILDTIKIISHSAYQNRPHIEAAAHFTLAMADHLADVPTMETLLDPGFRSDSFHAIDPEIHLSRVDKIGIAAAIGEQRLAGKPIDLAPIVDTFGGSSEGRRGKVAEWGKKVAEQPWKAGEELRIVAHLGEIPRVLREYPDVDPTVEQLIRFIKHHAPELVRYTAEITDERRAFMVNIFRRHVEQFHLRDLPVTTALSKIHHALAFHVYRGLVERGGYRGTNQKIYMYTGTAIRLVLGVPEGESFRDGGKYDTPEDHAILTRPEVQTAIAGWVAHVAASNGYCPALAAGLAIAMEAESDVA